MVIRFFDIVFSGIALLFLSPLLLVVALILKVSGEGEIFFVQDRVGKEKDLFGLFKFATMIKDSQNMGTGTITVKDDPRVKFLDFSSIQTKSLWTSSIRDFLLQRF